MIDIKVIITGASYDRVNNNATMRKYVAEGFHNLVGTSHVRNVPLQFCIRALQEEYADFVLVFGSCMPDDCDYNQLRFECHRLGTKLVFWLHDDPYEQDFNYKILDVADLIFSNDKWASHFYAHEHCYHLPMAASKAAHFRPVRKDWAYDLFFCGVAFDNRVKLLRDLKPFIKLINCYISGAGWPDDLLFCKNERIENTILPDYINESRFTLNIGRHLSLGNDRYQLDPSTPGPRTFETAMAGSVQLFFVEALEIEEYYEPGKEIILFNSADDLKNIVEQFKDDPEAIYQIAVASQQRTLSDHTYENRCSDILQKVLALTG